jgi:hypothetical protein
MTATAFESDPVASHSAQFPLGCPMNAPIPEDVPSPHGVRQWGLRWMSAPEGVRFPVPNWRYDHRRQVATNADGRPLLDVLADPTAHSKTNLDGDEGPNEDWIYDFCPDGEPQPV